MRNAPPHPAGPGDAPGRSAGGPKSAGEPGLVTEEALARVSAFLADQGICRPLSDLFAEATDQRLSAQCYVVSDEQILLIQRQKEPFIGRWTAPGGKLEAGEDPLSAVQREMQEEAGIEILAPRLVAVVSETGGPGYNWLLFVFRADAWRGEPASSGEGRIEWKRVAALADIPMPSVDKHLLPHVLDDSGAAPVLMRVHYDLRAEVERLQVLPVDPCGA